MPEPTLTLPVELTGDDALLDAMVNDQGMCQLEASRLLWPRPVQASGPLRPIPRAIAGPRTDREVTPMKKHALRLGVSCAAWLIILTGALVFAERKAAQAAGLLL